ncbi:MAG: ECF transporter S component [Acutalibacteraceae bacterium]|nr:ECF transporter S component [Acutalibacteraceae bacterium]
MAASKKKKPNIQSLATGGILTALVVVLQMLGQFIKFGPFSISLVLVPIVLGAALCGTKVSTWLGFVFGIAVLYTDAGLFLEISPIGTVITVMLKGTLCGLAAGLVYNALNKKLKKNTFAVMAAALVCPVVNTGIFLLGCVVFFLETVRGWGVAGGFENVATYLIVGMVGINFLVELAINIFLSPVVVRIIGISKKLHK